MADDVVDCAVGFDRSTLLRLSLYGTYETEAWCWQEHVAVGRVCLVQWEVQMEVTMLVIKPVNCGGGWGWGG